MRLIALALIGLCFAASATSADEPGLITKVLSSPELRRHNLLPKGFSFEVQGMVSERGLVSWQVLLRGKDKQAILLQRYEGTGRLHEEGIHATYAAIAPYRELLSTQSGLNDLLSRTESKLIRGWLINDHRGDEVRYCFLLDAVEGVFDGERVLVVAKDKARLKLRKGARARAVNTPSVNLSLDALSSTEGRSGVTGRLTQPSAREVANAAERARAKTRNPKR